MGHKDSRVAGVGQELFLDWECPAPGGGGGVKVQKREAGAGA